MIYVDLQQSTFYIVLFKSLLKTQVYLTHTSSLSLPSTLLRGCVELISAGLDERRRIGVLLLL